MTDAEKKEQVMKLIRKAALKSKLSNKESIPYRDGKIDYAEILLGKRSKYSFDNSTGYQLEAKPFAKGGEGSVYSIIGHPGLVAKLYHEKGRTKLREEKIRTMLANPPSDKLRSQIAWPTDILIDNGQFLGFVMPRIQKTTKIDILYSYDKRDNHSWSWYIQVARNLCAAINGIHESGHVCGDLNPANICVAEDTGLVTLVDTDSYHIHSPSGKEYRCPVCMPAYVPYEIHEIINSGYDLRSAPMKTFTKETDLFALAVHIFALLLNGCHPYACSVPDGVSASSFQISNNILNGVCAFFTTQYQINIPKYAASLNIFPVEMRNLFRRVFCDKPEPQQRPTAVEWYNALGRLDRTLANCTSVKTHQYCQETYDYCPWCLVDSRMGKLLENKVTNNQRTKPVIHVQTAQFHQTAPAAPARPSGITTSKARFTVPKAHISIPSVNITMPGFVPKLMMYLLLVIIEAAWGVLPQYLIAKKFSFSFGIGTVLGLICIGIYPFIPIFITRILAYFTGNQFLSMLYEKLAAVSAVYPFLMYAALLLFNNRGNDWFGIAFTTVLAGAVSMVMRKLLKGLIY